jgi:IMP dehydrogenase
MKKIEERIVRKGLTFDDILILPGKSETVPADVNVQTRLTRQIQMNIPLLSAAMDTVTESATAIAMAKEGGIGVIHKNLPLSQQAKEIKIVKYFTSHIVADPRTISPEMTIGEVRKLVKDHHDRFASFPVVDGDKRLVGLLTSKSYNLARDSEKVGELMRTKREVVKVPGNITREDARLMLREQGIGKLVVVDEEERVCGLITTGDILKAEKYPNACLDEKGRLRVAAAIGVSKEDATIRAEALIKAGVDVLVIDSAHGHSAGVIRAIQAVKSAWPNIEIIAGNIATAAAAFDLIKAGADALKVGMGPGSICTTRVIAGIGVPQVTAISEVVSVACKHDISVIADGGIKYSGDITKALAVGADSVMIGSLFAGTEESPGEQIIYQGRSYKVYRGMGSLGAMQDGSAGRYCQEGQPASKLVPEGIEGRVPARGSIASNIYQLVGGLKSGMGYAGCANLVELRENAEFVRITSAGLRESHPHDVSISNEAPNYQTND